MKHLENYNKLPKDVVTIFAWIFCMFGKENMLYRGLIPRNDKSEEND